MLRALCLALSAFDAVSGFTASVDLTAVRPPRHIRQSKLYAHVVDSKNIRDTDLFRTSLHTVTAVGTRNRWKFFELFHHLSDCLLLFIRERLKIFHISRIVL